MEPQQLSTPSVQPDPGTLPPQSLLTLKMNEDQPPPGAEPQRRGSSRNSISLTNAPGDLQATWGPTQTHMLLTQNHSSPLHLQPQAEASPLPTLLPTRAVRGLRPPQTPKASPTGSGVVGGEGLVGTELLLFLLLGWSNQRPPAPHRLKAGGTPCSLSAVLHGPRARFPHRASFQDCSVPWSSICRHDVACIFRERVTQFSGLKKQ